VVRGRGALAALGIAIAAAGCRPFPAGWLYVSAVTTDAATLVWTGPDAEVNCRDFAGASVGMPPQRSTPGRGLHVVRLEGLAPAMRYTCGVGTLGRVRFRTAPPPGSPFTFAAVGDTGDGSREAAALARRILAGRPAFLIHLGDMAYPSSKPDLLDARFFRPYRKVLARVPLFPTPGNHDLTRGSAYGEVFRPIAQDPARGGPHYAFDWAEAHFDSIASPEFGPDGDPGWLADDLAHPLARRRWRIVFLHEFLFSAGSKSTVPGLRTRLQPVLEAGGVHLLLTGHSHLYERTLPACLFVPTARVQEVVSGGGGDNLDPQPPAHSNFPRVLSVTHYLRVHVTADALDVRAVDLSGRVLDHMRRRFDQAAPCRAGGWPVPRDR
jgi:acid phosphatase type 7